MSASSVSNMAYIRSAWAWSSVGKAQLQEFSYLESPFLSPWLVPERIPYAVDWEMLDGKSHDKRPANVRTVPCRDSKRHLDFLHPKFSMVAVSALQRKLADGITSRPRKVGESLKAVNARQQIMGEVSSSRFQGQGYGRERVQVMGEIAALQPGNASQLWLSGRSARIEVCLIYNDAQHKKRYRFLLGLASTGHGTREQRRQASRTSAPANREVT
jgi:hypothetical protein